MAGDRFSSKRTSSEVQSRLHTLVSAGGFSASRLVLGFSPVDLMELDDRDEDLLLAQDTSLPGQVARQWELRVIAQESALKGTANSALRRLLARDKSLFCTDVEIGDSALSYKAANRMSTPRRRGPTKFLDIDEAGATVKFQGQRFKLAHTCVRKKTGRYDVSEVEWDPANCALDSRG